MAGERPEYLTLRAIPDRDFPGRIAYREGEGISAQVVADWALESGTDVRPADTKLLPRPAGNAKRAEWAGYAAMRGVPQEEIDRLGRDELRDHPLLAEEHPAEQGAEPKEEA